MSKKAKTAIIIFFVLIVVFFIAYLIYITYLDTVNQINSSDSTSSNNNTDDDSGDDADNSEEIVNPPKLTASSLTMKDDGNYNAVINSYSNYKLVGERNTAIVIVSNQMAKLYANSTRPNATFLFDSQLYDLLTSTSIPQFETYIRTYYPAFKNANEIMNFYHDGNYQAVVVPFSNGNFSNSLYGDARNAAIVMIGAQIGILYPSIGPTDTSGLKDIELYNLLTADSFNSFKKLLRTYSPGRNF